MERTFSGHHIELQNTLTYTDCLSISMCVPNIDMHRWSKFDADGRPLEECLIKEFFDIQSEMGEEMKIRWSNIIQIYRYSKQQNGCVCSIRLTELS